MKTNILKRLGLFILILILCIGVSNCRTAKNNVVKEISKENTEIRNQQIIDSLVSINIIKSEGNASADHWKSYFENYNISYIGLSADDSFSIIKTDSSYQFQGKGTFTSNTTNQATEAKSETNNTLNHQEETAINSASNQDYSYQHYNYDKTKQHEDSSSGFNWSFTLVLSVLVVVALYLAYRFYLRKATI